METIELKEILTSLESIYILAQKLIAGFYIKYYKQIAPGNIFLLRK